MGCFPYILIHKPVLNQLEQLHLALWVIGDDADNIYLLALSFYDVILQLLATLVKLVNYVFKENSVATLRSILFNLLTSHFGICKI